CPNEIYNARMAAACSQLKAEGADHVIFGDLFLTDIRAYREKAMAPLGMTPIFPLWMRDTKQLAGEMIDTGIEAYLTCVDPRALDRSFAGRRFDRTLLSALPTNVDPCGENGEFHTIVTAGPMFDSAIDIDLGEIAERDGFIYADFLLRSEGE